MTDSELMGIVCCGTHLQPIRNNPIDYCFDRAVRTSYEFLWLMLGNAIDMNVH